MSKKVVFTAVLLAVVCTGLFAGGRRASNESRTASDHSGFTDSFDAVERPAGKYNFYVEAVDRAGNRTISGPENIYIDPRTDLPGVTIINPLSAMRVQGNMNIVGIAIDDDGVGFVEISITRGRGEGGEEIIRTRANGTDYWSYFLDTSNSSIWTDGIYTITAWATDINGLSGISEDFKPKDHKKHSISWHLDRKRPEITIESHEVGELVSGRVRLRGTVKDGNGITDFRFSPDGGNTYTPVRTRYVRNEDHYTWEVELQTNRVFEDGPAVIWFQSRDGMGSVGTAAHLLFVNNTGPEVSIVYPEPDETLSGFLTIAGSASHPVGIRSVTWKAGNLSGEFDMIPGNSWWSANIDIRNQRGNSLDVEVRAVDVSGNATVARQRYRLDQNAGLPTVTLLEPAAGAVISEGDLIVKGNAADKVGVRSVFYSLNGQEAQEILCSGYFQFSVPGLEEGSYNLEIWAQNIIGQTGPKVLVRNIVVGGEQIQPRIASVTTGSGGSAIIEDFYTGMTVRLEPRVRASMDIEIKASAVNSASVTFADEAPIALRPSGRDGILRATVQVPPNLMSGFTTVELRAVDRLGREVVYPEYIFIDQQDPAVPEPFNMGRWFHWIRPNEFNGNIFIGSRDEVLIGLADQPVSRVTLNGEGAENLTVSTDQFGRVTMRGSREGRYGPLTVTIGTFQSLPFHVIVGFGGPSINIIERPRDWVQSTVPVTFRVSSAYRVTSIEYSMDMGVSWQNLVARSDLQELTLPVNEEFSADIDISRVEDGSVNLLIRAVNELGRSTVTNLTVLKDTKPPAARVIMPVSGSMVNGNIRLGFAIEEAGALKSVRYYRPEGSRREISMETRQWVEIATQEINREVFNADRWNEEFAPVFLDILSDVNTMPLDENMRFIFEDKAGNQSEIRYWPFTIDRELDKPVVQIILPAEGDVLTSDFIVSGVMYDDDGIKQIYWNIDGGAEQVIVAENGFYIPVRLAALTDNEHTITVVAEDIYGTRGEPVTRNFKVSLSEPTAQMTSPLYSAVLKETVDLVGNASDGNGIKEVFVSLDNGNTFNRAAITGKDENDRETTSEEWTYRFNSKILEDGAHVVFIRVVDNFDISATYASMINIDNTPPEVTLDSPTDGLVSTGSFTVLGRTDDVNLAEVVMEIRSLSGEEVSENLSSRRLPARSVLRENLNFAGQADGLYNIEITATDAAGNITRVSRNFELARESIGNYVNILYPLDFENVSGEFFLYGYAGGIDNPHTVTLRINGRDSITEEVDDTGYFRFALDSTRLNRGQNRIVAHSNFGGRESVMSEEQILVYRPDGPWVTIDSFNFGDFAFNRPYIYGRTGYALSEEDLALLEDKETSREVKAAIQNKAPSKTQISFDNGRTFITMDKGKGKDQDFRYRLETGEMPEGQHYILIRSTMKNGETAVARMLVQVDKTNPVVRVITPEAGGRYNESITFSASATDDVEVVELTYHLRAGDKNAYGVPGFLQGMYIEAVLPPFIKQAMPKNVQQQKWTTFLNGGVTYMDFGLGLSFFDDNVKVQFQYGFMTQALYEAVGGERPLRYGGNVFGIKLLANLYSLPFGAIGGPDWEWLSASFAVGANFSLFSITQNDNATWLSSLLLQIEFPKVTLATKRNYLRKFSMFTEGQLWFVATDVKAKELGIPLVFTKIVIGLRLYIF